MDRIIEPILCNGCHACYAICPKRCIDMIQNEEGFLEPSIDKDKCIECNLCTTTCPVNNDLTIDDKNKLISIVAINKDDNIREKSSSGGVFTEIANYILDKNGCVYGAGFNNNFEVEHMKITDKSEIYKLQGSKYVQSKIGKIFLEVEKDLKKNKFVLFTGTPCQIEGLKSYLGKDYEKLYTQDIICHGVPSPKAWRKYINEFNEDIKSISFRDKTYGWLNFSVKIESQDNKYINTKDIFLQSFLKNLNLRKSCYNCKFKQINRHSDITLADCWGIENIDKKYFDDKGTSLVILHSDKGEFLYNEIKSKFISSSINLEEAIKYNTAINKSVEMTNARSKFFKNIDKYNYKEVFQKSIDITLHEKIKIFLSRTKCKIKKLLKVI